MLCKLRNYSRKTVNWNLLSVKPESQKSEDDRYLTNMFPLERHNGAQFAQPALVCYTKGEDCRLH